VARHRFGGVADYIISVGSGNAAVLEPAATVTCWNQAVGGTQYTDLTESDGATPITGGTLTADSTGAVGEFYGPDQIRHLYLDANGGSGPRRRTVATDIGADVGTLRTDLDAHTAARNPHGTTAADLAGAYDPSIATLRLADPFYVAHRGSGDEYPEHTLVAYEAALNAGARAIEVSCQITADGQLVTFHDQTLTRMTGLTGALSDYTYAAVKNAIKVKPQAFYGPGWDDVEIPLLRDVLDRLYGRCVIFLEPKTNEAIVPLQTLLSERYPDAQRSIVWKHYYSNGSFTWARNNGYTTWGYVDAGTTQAEMDAIDSLIDMWGVPHTMTDGNIASTVARGKPVICWEVHRRADVTRLTGLGVQGLMCSGYEYVTRSTPVLTSDNWEFQVRAPGDIGLANYDPDYALKFGADNSAYVSRTNTETNLLGSFCPTPADGYTISCEMRFENVPAASLHADFVFAKPDDAKYQFNASNSSGGYHFVFRGNGDMQLYKHTPGVTSGTKLGELLASAQPDGAAAVQPVAGAWMWFSIEVTPTQIIISRTDLDTPSVLTVSDTSYRGGYIHLSNGSINSDSLRPYWRNLSIA
jgi:glycerophosphoryl diester phosphodiesterase